MCLDRFYIDYFNAATTFSMYLMLQRWNCMLKQKDKSMGICLNCGPTVEIHERFEAKGALPLSLMGDISTDGNAPSHLKVEVSASYGIKAEIMTLQKAGNEND